MLPFEARRSTMALYSNDDLERLVERCRQGDADAWGQLVSRFQAMVYSIPRRHGLAADDAADVFQTTFHTLYRNLDRIDSALGLPRWLSLTAARESLRIKRISGRYASTEDFGIVLDEVVASEEASAEREAVSSAESESLRLAVADLAPRCRELITLLYLQGDVPYADVADRLRMPVGSIGPTRARCLEKLRRLLGRDGFFE